MALEKTLFYRETRYFCGEFLDVDIYPVFQKPGAKRKKCKPSSDIQQRLNERNSQKYAVRQANSNFGENDMSLHLSFAKEPSREEATGALKNYYRSVRRLREKLGLEPLKYMYCIEQGKKSGRIHFHVIMSGGIERNTLEEMWKHGRANTRRLQYDSEGLEGLIRYITKRNIQKDGKRRWTSSKNLIKPEPKSRDYEITRREMTELAEGGCLENMAEAHYPGYECFDAVPMRNGVNHGWYINIRLRKEKINENRQAKKKPKPDRPADYCESSQVQSFSHR